MAMESWNFYNHGIMAMIVESPRRCCEYGTAVRRVSGDCREYYEHTLKLLCDAPAVLKHSLGQSAGIAIGNPEGNAFEKRVLLYSTAVTAKGAGHGVHAL